MLKSRFSTESYFTWQLDAERFTKKAVKVHIKIPNGC